MNKSVIGIQVSGVTAKEIAAHEKAIKSILTLKGLDQKTLQLALKVYEKGIKAPEHVSIQDVNVNMDAGKIK